MEGELKHLSRNELELELTDLENTYADLLADEGTDRGTLRLVWDRIREVRTELKKRAIQ